MSKENDQKSIIKKAGLSSGHTKPAKPKRPFAEVAELSAEEVTLLAAQMDEISSDVKLLRDSVATIVNKTETMMDKNEMKDFIKSTVEEIMTEINKNMELTIDIKVNAKTAKLSTEMNNLKEENMSLKSEIKKLKDRQSKSEEIAQSALEKANYNEQYSRKNNFKVLNVTERSQESETTLTQDVCNLFNKQNATMNPDNIMAIHRIPGKPGVPKPVLVKLKNNTEKSKLMRTRSAMKAAGHRLVDDVTKLNYVLIINLNNHPKIDAAWYFNGSVYGKTKTGNRVKFDIYDNVDKVIEKA